MDEIMYQPALYVQAGHYEKHDKTDVLVAEDQVKEQSIAFHKHLDIIPYTTRKRNKRDRKSVV